MNTGANYNQADKVTTGGMAAFRPAADNIPDMRGIKETAERFGLPVHFVRALVNSGRIVAVQAGSKKFYVNQASMIAFLNGENTERGQAW